MREEIEKLAERLLHVVYDSKLTSKTFEPEFKKVLSEHYHIPTKSPSLVSEELWPDEVRLKMLNKGQFYEPNEKVYHYGYYDGYQHAKERLLSTLKEGEKDSEDLGLKNSNFYNPNICLKCETIGGCICD